ncbi:methyltransferase [Streptomyces sp. YU58]|uniref:methyltransferase n=1 Tax=Streptomyces sp. SX92 TaxID=3158972 RepID=UPI0027BA7725|nr:methyltransferase [Streptomyces coralus]WLW57125.1 methyltransferase [Streptomyces coralus]
MTSKTSKTSRTSNETRPDRPAPAQLLEFLSAKWISQAIGVTARLGIADLVADAPLTAAELAAMCEADADALHRVLRATASVGVFTEDADGRFGLTPLADLLRTDAPGSLRAAAITMNLDPMWRPYGHIEHSVRTGRPAFDHVYGVTIHQYLRDHPGQAELFQEASVGFYRSAVPPIVDAYDFGPFSTVVDVGGGIGFLLSAILRRNPRGRGVLFETPGVITAARKALADDPAAERITFDAGDFFERVTPGGDLYLIKSCLHNWGDRDAGRVLATIRAAMAPTARLLVVESVVPDGNGPHYSKLSDLELLVLAGGRERRADEWQALFETAGFHQARVIPTAGPITLMELRPETAHSPAPPASPVSSTPSAQVRPR